MSFVDALNDYYLSQITNIPTRGSNIFKSRHIGLATYLKSLTSELNEYISSGSCEQVKLLANHIALFSQPYCFILLT
jgi:hypothetical protein